MKQKLYEQGLFEFDIKKPIPAYPKRVGIVTAQTGAAIQDIRNIAKRRNPYVQLILYPAKVQGDGAAEDIAHGIEVLDNMGVDTIIIGRGGGSIEDLWAFNEGRSLHGQSTMQRRRSFPVQVMRLIIRSQIMRQIFEHRHHQPPVSRQSRM